jgi:hypothetical protein
MRFKWCCFLLILAQSYFGPSSTAAWDATAAWRSFSEIDRDIRLIAAEEGQDPSLREKTTKTLVAYEQLRSLTKDDRQWASTNFAPGYSYQLNRDQQILHSMVRGHSRLGAKDIDDLDAALADIYLKVNACLMHGGKAVDSVSVTVHTKKSGVEVPNLRIMCMEKILRLYDNYSPTEFPQLSSPTKWQLAPGNYLIWAENPGTGEKSTMQEIPIDRNQECDLAVQ